MLISQSASTLEVDNFSRKNSSGRKFYNLRFEIWVEFADDNRETSKIYFWLVEDDVFEGGCVDSGDVVKPKRQRDVRRRLLTRSVVDALGHVEVTEQGDGVGPVPQILLKQLKNSTFLLSRTKARTKRHAPYFCFRIFHLTRMGKHNLHIAHFLNMIVWKE